MNLKGGDWLDNMSLVSKNNGSKQFGGSGGSST